MYRKRNFTDGTFYHVTSRTNNKVRVFETRLGQKVMLLTLQEAKVKYHFRLDNFCIMPTHIHLLIKPEKEANLSKIMWWIKSFSAKRWNCIHNSKDHMWGARYYAGAIKSQAEYDAVMNYIDQNPVLAGLALTPADWEASGAYHKANNLSDLMNG